MLPHRGDILTTQPSYNLPVETIIPMATTPLKFGFGATEELGYELNRLKLKKVVLVSDGQITASGLVDKIEKILTAAEIEFIPYYEVGVEPTDISFTKAISFLADKTCEGFVAVGGGSVIDTAKAMNLYGTYPADLLEYINPPIGRGMPAPGPLKPLIAVPTTAGTGSEATTVIVLDLLDQQVKTGISHFYIRPTMALIDPLNTLTMPPLVTAASGMDVLTHAIESYTAVPYNTRYKPQSPAQRPPYMGANLIADLWSREAIRLGGAYLRRAMMSPCDLDARYHMMAASTFAGIGFGNVGVHIPHALGYPIAGMVKDYYPPDYPNAEPMVPHGISVSVTAPACFRFTAPAQLERHLEAATFLGYQTRGIPLKEAGDCLAQALIDLMKDIGFPNGIEALGYGEEDIPNLVEGAWKQQRLLTISPRRPTPEDLAEIFRQSLKNW